MKNKKIVGSVEEANLPYRWYLTEYTDNGQIMCERVLARSWVEADQIAEENGEVVIGLLMAELDAEGNPLGGDLES